MSVVLYMRIDQVMLSEMLNDRAVGIFSAAVRVSEAWYFVPMAMVAAVAPALTAIHSTSEEDYRRNLATFVRTMLYLSFVVAVLLTFFSKQVITFLYGPGYAAAAPVLAVHAWAGLFVALGVATGPWFVNSGMLIMRMVHTLVGTAINVCLNLVLIPRFGPVGAAVATLISYSAASLWLNAFSKRTRPVLRIQLAAFLGTRT